MILQLVPLQALQALIKFVQSPEVMAKNKTTATLRSVDDFILAVDDETKRDDSYELIKIFKSVTGEQPFAG